MGLRQSQIQTLQQRLSPQQIQFIKLLQMSTLDFEERVGEELLDNPALEKGENEVDFSDNASDFSDRESSDEWGDDYQRDIDVDEMIRASGNDDEYGTFRMGEDYSNDEQKEMPMASTSSCNAACTTISGLCLSPV